MADDAAFSIDSSGVVSAVNTAEKALDRMLQVLQNLDRATASLATHSQSALAKVNATMKAMNTQNYTAFMEAQQNGLASIQTGSVQAIRFIKEQNQALQGLYEARVATAGRISNQELQVWKNYGVNLGMVQRAQLKGWNLDSLVANTEAATDKLRNLILSKLGNLAVDNSPLRSIRASTEQDSQAILKSMADFYGRQEVILGKLGVLGLDNSPLRSIRVTTPQDADMVMSGMRKFYADQERILNKLGMLAQDNSPLRSIRKTMPEDSAAILAEMNKFYSRMEAQAATRQAIMQRRATTGMVDRVSGSTPDSATTLTAMRDYYLAMGATSKNATTSFEAFNRTAEQTAAVSGRTANAFKKLTADGNDVHSMARGLASGFNLLWLTWGNLAPLFIGAAISNSFMSTARAGLEVGHTLGIIEHVGGNTTAAMGKLREELDLIAASGPKGPREVAEAMRVLSLAGLDANKILAVTKDVLNFSVAGTTNLETAAETLVAVTTAFGMGPQGFGQAADIISKAAAESMSSVEGFSNAMKTASVISAQYGVSLEDTATGIAALANLGIQATAAGTALRNMYADLSGRSMQVAKILRQQGIELRDATTGGFRPLIDVVGELNTKFQALDAISQKNLMQALLSERGAKGIVEALRLINTEATDMGLGLTNALAVLRRNIGESEGFAAIAAARMAQTAENQFKQVRSVLETSMVQAFREMEPTLYIIADSFQRIFASQEFKDGLTFMVTNIAQLGLVVAENASLLTKLAVGYGLLKVAQMGVVSSLSALNVLMNMRSASVTVETNALNANTVAQNANNVAKAGALTKIGALARVVPFIGTALMAASAAWLAYEFFMSKSNDTSDDFHELYNNKVAKDLEDQAKKLNMINALRAEGYDLQSAQQQAERYNPKAVKEVKDAQATVDNLRQQIKELQSSDNVRNKIAPKLVQQEVKAMETQLKAAEDRVTAIRAAEKRAEEAAKSMTSARSWDKYLNEQDLAARLNTQVTGPGSFELGNKDKDYGNNRAANALNGLLEREKELAATYAAESVTVSESLIERAKKMTELEERYKQATKESAGLNAAQRAEIETTYKLTKAMIESNNVKRIDKELAKLQAEDSLERAKALEAEVKAVTDLNRAQQDAMRNRQREILDREDDLARSEANQFHSTTFQRAMEEQARVARKYRDLMEEERQKYLTTLSSLTDPALATGATAAHEDRMTELNTQRIRDTAVAQAKVYSDAWNQATRSIADNFVNQMMDGTFELGDFIVDTFANMVLKPMLQVGMQQGFDMLLGGAGGWFSSLLSFEGGGSTGSGPRSGGLDGRGGYLAMVHPDETVIDHKNGGGAGGQPVQVNIYNTVGDVATKSMLDKAMQQQQRQIQAGIGRSMRYNGALA